MALIKEDGTGLSDANVYADASDLNSYASLRNIDLSSYDNTELEAALFIAAQDWVDGMHCFAGDPLNEDQSMKMPTTEIDLTSAKVSRDIVNANCNTAILQLNGVLFVEVEVDSKNGDIIKTKDKLDVLETEIEYSEGTAIRSGTYDTTTADNLIKPYLGSYCSGGVKAEVW